MPCENFLGSSFLPRNILSDMGRSLYHPYNPKNPRTVRGAKKRGWTVVDVDISKLPERVTWLGLCIWADQSLKGYWINSYFHREFAFESSADATMFQLKWG